MKTKNRNKKFTTQLVQTSCILAAGVLGFSGITAGVLSNILPQSVFAANQTIHRTSHSDIGENEIQFLVDKINLSNSDDVNIVTTGQLKKMVSKCYTEAEIQNGTYDTERDSQVSYHTATENYCGTMNIVYDFGDSLATGTHDVNGTISLTWSNAAHDADGNSYDVKIYIDNIEITNNFVATRPISIMAEREHAVRPAVQEIPASQLSANYDILGYNLGGAYDVMVSVLQPGTNTPVTGKKTVYRMSDLDQPDHINASVGEGTYVDNSGNPAPFTESVTLISGIEPDIYVGTNSFLTITNTEYGNNTRFSATQQTSNDEWEFSSVTFRGDVSGFKYRWYGSVCGTPLGWVGSKIVTTSTSGTYKDHGQITPTDDEVLWKEDKTITALPDNGYYVSKITVDGQEITFTPDENGMVTYTFDDVIANHAIDVQFAPYFYKVTVHHYKKGTTTKLASDVIEEDHITGDSYTSSAADVEGYKVVEKPEKETVIFEDHDIELIYYYEEEEKEEESGNPNTGDMNIGTYTTTATGLTALIAGVLLFATKKRR